MPRTGDLIGDKLRLEQPLGRGGMGEVWCARHVELRHRVAVKFLSVAATGDQHARERFRKEALAVARLRGEHVVRVHDVGVAGDHAYLVMELVEGETLGHMLARVGTLPVADAVGFIVEACEALAEAHAAGIVHRDIKPQNLMCASRPGGQRVLKVVDFGVAKSTLSNDALTLSQGVLGSPAYMAPEQLSAPHKVDARADVWGLGVTLYELLSGRRPYDDQSSVLSQLATRDPIPLATFCPGLPQGLLQAVARATTRDVTLRTPSVAALADDLAPFIDDGARRAAVVARVAAERSACTAAEPAFGTETAPNAGGWVERDPVHSQLAVTRTAARDDVGVATRPRVARWALPLALAVGAGVFGGWRVLARPPDGTPPAPSAAVSTAAPASSTSDAPAVSVATANPTQVTATPSAPARTDARRQPAPMPAAPTRGATSAVPPLPGADAFGGRR